MRDCDHGGGAQPAPRAAGQIPGDEPERRWFEVIPFWALVVVYLALLLSAGAALSIGLPDTFLPVSLSPQLVGVTYLIAGALVVCGLWHVLRLVTLLAADGSAKASAGGVAHHLTFVSIAALAGLYVDFTIVGYSSNHKPLVAAAFAVPALICLAFAAVTLRVVWNSLGGAIKAVGISIAALVTVAQFWYQSVYVPQNVPIGMNFSVTLGRVTQSGGHRLIELNLTAEDGGATAALDLGSMVVIRAMTAADLHSGTMSPRILRIQPLAKLSGFFFPDDTITDQIVLRLTDPSIVALNVTLQVYFARANWLTLGSEQAGVQVCRGPDLSPGSDGCTERPQGILDPLTCRRFVQNEFVVLQSALRTFTQGTHAVYSHWHCDGWQDQEPYIDAWIYPNIRPAAPDLGIIHSMRSEVLLLPKDGSKF